MKFSTRIRQYLGWGKGIVDTPRVKRDTPSPLPVDLFHEDGMLVVQMERYTVRLPPGERVFLTIQNEERVV